MDPEEEGSDESNRKLLAQREKQVKYQNTIEKMDKEVIEVIDLGCELEEMIF